MMAPESQEIVENFTIKPEKLKEDALILVSRIRPEWKVENLVIKEFTDGITNHLLGCFPANDEEDPILIRVYGKNTELFIDRKKELRSMKLMNSHQLCPPVFCSFNNGLAYGYSKGSCLDDKMAADKQISTSIAKMLARMHSIKLPSDWQKEKGKMEACCFKLARHYLDLLNDIPNSSNGSGPKNTPTVKDLTREVDFMEILLSSIGSPLVFCHNDLLLKNIVYNDKTSDVRFIDFEYADINYQAFDIANHFCEFAGVTDFNPQLYPSKEFQLEWLENYLKEWNELSKIPETGDKIDNNMNDCVSKNGHHDADFEKRLNTLHRQVNKFSLMCHLYWAIWSLLQARHSSIHFDYHGYAKSRLGEYFKNKEKILSINNTVNHHL